jgi:hypothetical protein
MGRTFHIRPDLAVMQPFFKCFKSKKGGLQINILSPIRSNLLLFRLQEIRCLTLPLSVKWA